MYALTHYGRDKLFLHNKGNFFIKITVSITHKVINKH